MKNKRVLILIMVIALVSAIIAPCASAKDADISVEGIVNGPNAICFAMFNPECRYKDKLKDVKLKITKAGTDINIEIPIKPVNIDELYSPEDLKKLGDSVDEFMDAKDSMELTFWTSDESAKLSDVVMEQLKAIQGDVDLGKYDDDGDKLFEAIDKCLGNFKLELVGEGTDHYSIEGGAFVLTSDIVNQVVNMIKDAYKEEADKEFTSFSDLVKEFMSEMEIDMKDLPSDIQKEINDLIANIDPIMEYLQGNDFKGIFLAGVSADCDCITLNYTVLNQYYKNVNGKLELVGQEYVMNGNKKIFTAYNGDKINFTNYIDNNYNGKNYKYLGCYNYDEYDYEAMSKIGDWDDYAISNADSFVLDDDSYYEIANGVILCYVVDETAHATPDTGDEVNTAVAIFAGALLAGGVSILLKKKKSA